FSRWNWERQLKSALGVPSTPDSNGPTGSRWAHPMKPLSGSLLRTPQVADPLVRGAEMATEVFERMGFAAELAAASEPSASLSADSDQIVGRERIIRLHACPVRDLARAHPEVACGVHLGLLHGLLTKAEAADSRPDTQHLAMSSRLEPFVEPELCLARVSFPRGPA